MDLNLYCIKGTLALFVLVSSFLKLFWLPVLDKAEYLAFESTLNNLYRIISYRSFSRIHSTSVVVFLNHSVAR